MLTSVQKVFLTHVQSEYGILQQITAKQIKYVSVKYGIPYPQWLTKDQYRISRSLYRIPGETMISQPTESKEEISARIRETYEAMDELVQAVAANTVNSLVIAGGAGLGKSYTVNKTLQKVNQGDYGYVFHRGYLKATHLFRLLYENRFKGQVVVLDDCDLWHDETALNILKAALELKPTRRIGWGSEKVFLDEDGEEIPRYFDFEGSVIFLTNLSVRDLIASGSKNAPHLAAIESRSLLLDLKIKTKEEYMIKIKQTLEGGMLRDIGITKPQEEEIVSFMEDNIEKLSDVSLRMIEKIAALYKAKPESWMKICRTVCFK